MMSRLEEISRNSGSNDGYDIRIQVHTMPNVGHWLHTENWPGVLEIVDKESGCFF